MLHMQGWVLPSIRMLCLYHVQTQGTGYNTFELEGHLYFDKAGTNTSNNEFTYFVKDLHQTGKESFISLQERRLRDFYPTVFLPLETTLVDQSIEDLRNSPLEWEEDTKGTWCLGSYLGKAIQEIKDSPNLIPQKKESLLSGTGGLSSSSASSSEVLERKESSPRKEYSPRKEPSPSQQLTVRVTQKEEKSKPMEIEPLAEDIPPSK